MNQTCRLEVQHHLQKVFWCFGDIQLHGVTAALG